MFNMSNTVKQERPDDAEINELAAKIVEAYKSKVPQIPRTTATPTKPQISNSIIGYLTKTNGKGKTETTMTNLNSAEKPNAILDDRSQRGQFGWSTLGKIHIPFIFRGEDKYCAVRMVEMKVLNKYLSFLHQDIYNCTCIRSYYITEAEGRLLNEINFIHCDSIYGRDQFTGRDLIVRLSDAVEFYNFLDACYSKLLNGSSNPLDRCGFIRINKESVVPYTIYNGDKFVPLFYFEGETDNLKLRANKLEGWDLSYLKFCCKVQGIRNELFAHDSCSVISLNDIRNYFPPGTTFEDYWPQKMVDTQFLISNKSSNQTQVGQWTRQPSGPPINTHPPPSPKPATQAKAAANINQLHNVQSMYTNYAMGTAAPQYQPRAATAAVRTNYGSVATGARQNRPAYNYTGMNPAPTPPPLVRSTVGPGTAYTTAQTTAANYLLMGETYRQQPVHKYHPPPPLIPVRHLNGGLRYENAQNHYPNTPADVVDLSPNNHQMINQQPAHQQPARSQPSSTQDDRTNGRINNVQRKLIQIPDTPTSGTHIPYKMQKAIIEGKMVPTINMKPYIHTDVLVSVNDLVSNFFNNVSVQACQQVMQVLGIEIYKGNPSNKINKSQDCLMKETIYKLNSFKPHYPTLFSQVLHCMKSFIKVATPTKHTDKLSGSKQTRSVPKTTHSRTAKLPETPSSSGLKDQLTAVTISKVPRSAKLPETPSTSGLKKKLKSVTISKVPPTARLTGKRLSSGLKEKLKSVTISKVPQPAKLTGTQSSSDLKDMVKSFTISKVPKRIQTKTNKSENVSELKTAKSSSDLKDKLKSVTISKVPKPIEIKSSENISEPKPSPSGTAKLPEPPSFSILRDMLKSVTISKVSKPIENKICSSENISEPKMSPSGTAKLPGPPLFSLLRNMLESVTISKVPKPIEIKNRSSENVSEPKTSQTQTAKLPRTLIILQDKLKSVTISKVPKLAKIKVPESENVSEPKTSQTQMAKLPTLLILQDKLKSVTISKVPKHIELKTPNQDNVSEPKTSQIRKATLSRTLLPPGLKDKLKSVTISKVPKLIENKIPNSENVSEPKTSQIQKAKLPGTLSSSSLKDKLKPVTISKVLKPVEINIPKSDNELAPVKKVQDTAHATTINRMQDLLENITIERILTESSGSKTNIKQESSRKEVLPQVGPSGLKPESVCNTNETIWLTETPQISSSSSEMQNDLPQVKRKHHKCTC